MNKRGTQLWILAGEIVIGVLLGLGYVYIATQAANKEAFYRNYIADDLLLTINTVLASPGDVAINYTGRLSDYVVELNNNLLKVYKYPPKEQSPTITDSLTTKRFISGMGDLDFESKFEKPESIVIAKINGRLIISDKQPLAVEALWKGKGG